MLKKFRLKFSGNLETESQAKKRIKRRQQELAARMKQSRAYQEQVFKRRQEHLDLT